MDGEFETKERRSLSPKLRESLRGSSEQIYHGAPMQVVQGEHVAPASQREDLVARGAQAAHISHSVQSLPGAQVVTLSQPNGDMVIFSQQWIVQRR